MHARADSSRSSSVLLAVVEARPCMFACVGRLRRRVIARTSPRLTRYMPPLLKTGRVINPHLAVVLKAGRPDNKKRSAAPSLRTRMGI